MRGWSPGETRNDRAQSLDETGSVRYNTCMCLYPGYQEHKERSI